MVYAQRAGWRKGDQNMVREGAGNVSNRPNVADEGKVVGKGRKGLRGAALDVTDPEPLPDGHRLFTAPNCTITPHISGLGTAYVERAFQVLDANLEHLFKGEEFINLVDRKRGY